MPKLLSEEEVNNFASQMTEEYGLPPPTFLKEASYSSYSAWNVRVEVNRLVKVRRFKWIPWLTKNSTRAVSNFYADSYEDGLVKLKQELAKFDNRAKIAEQFREKYTLKEADVLMDRILSE